MTTGRCRTFTGACRGDAMSQSLPPYLRVTNQAVVLSIKAQPRAGRTEIVGLLGSELKVKVAAPPVDSAANEALMEYLSERLKCPRRAVILVRGQTSTHKQVAVHGLTAEQIAERLQG